MEYDELLGIIGEFGIYQGIVFFLASMLSIHMVFNNMAIVFLAASPDHHCKVPGLDHLNLTTEVLKNLTIPETGAAFSKCDMYDRNYTDWTMRDVQDALSSHSSQTPIVPCQYGWSYDASVYQSTVVTEFDLVCDRESFVAASQSIYMAGLMVGSLLFGNVSDVSGRYLSLVVALVIGTVFSIGSSFADSYETFTILRFFIGSGVIGIFTVAFVLVVEMVGPSWRVFTGISIEYFWAAGYMIMGVLAYFIRDWKTLQLSHSVPTLIFFLFLLFIPESPRWLYANGKAEKAEPIVRKMARINRTKTPDDLHITIKENATAYLWDLFKYPRLRLRTIIVFFIWMVISCVYYGLSLNTSNLGGDDFVNFIVAGAVEIPAYICCNFILNNVGRRWPLSVSMALAGTMLLLTMAVPQGHDVWVVVLAMSGKFFITMSFGIIYVFSAELFPTVVRNVAVGAGSFWGRVGGVTAPQIARLAKFSKFIPLIVFAVMSLLAALACMVLPETNNRKLPETIEDGEHFPNEYKPEQKENINKQTELTYM